MLVQCIRDSFNWIDFLLRLICLFLCLTTSLYYLSHYISFFIDIDICMCLTISHSISISHHITISMFHFLSLYVLLSLSIFDLFWPIVVPSFVSLHISVFYFRLSRPFNFSSHRAKAARIVHPNHYIT